jgi:hypothetical protein
MTDSVARASAWQDRGRFAIRAIRHGHAGRGEGIGLILIVGEPRVRRRECLHGESRG